MSNLVANIVKMENKKNIEAEDQPRVPKVEEGKKPQPAEEDHDQPNTKLGEVKNKISKQMDVGKHTNIDQEEKKGRMKGSLKRKKEEVQEEGSEDDLISFQIKKWCTEKSNSDDGNELINVESLKLKLMEIRKEESKKYTKWKNEFQEL